MSAMVSIITTMGFKEFMTGNNQIKYLWYVY